MTRYWRSRPTDHQVSQWRPQSSKNTIAIRRKARQAKRHLQPRRALTWSRKPHRHARLSPYQVYYEFHKRASQTNNAKGFAPHPSAWRNAGYAQPGQWAVELLSIPEGDVLANGNEPHKSKVTFTAVPARKLRGPREGLRQTRSQLVSTLCSTASSPTPRLREARDGPPGQGT